MRTRYWLASLLLVAGLGARMNRVSAVVEVPNKEFVKTRRVRVDLKKSPLSESKRGSLIKQKALERAKSRILKAIDRMIGYLERVQKRAKLRINLRNDWQARFEEVSKTIAWLKAEKSEVEKIEDITQLRQLVKDIRSKWRKNKIEARKMLRKAILNRGRAILTKLENAGVKIKVVLDEFKNEGKDVSQAEALYQQYKAKLKVAEAKYEAAKKENESLVQAGSEGMTAKINKNLKAMMDEIRSAHKILKEIIKTIKDY